MALFEELSDHVVMNEIDPAVRVVWDVVFSDMNAELCSLITDFEMTRENAIEIENSTPSDPLMKAFRTIIRNRANHGGKLSVGTGMIKHGDGKGVASRWYPETLVKRISPLMNYSDRVTVSGIDGAACIQEYSHDKEAFAFIDPPYTASKKSPGSRLYDFSEIDHEELFDVTTNFQGRFLMTYELDDRVKVLAERHNLVIGTIPMKGTTHRIKKEALISRDMSWRG